MTSAGKHALLERHVYGPESTNAESQFGVNGDPHVLELVDVEEPHAGPGEIRIAVRAAEINGIEYRLRSGEMRDVMPLSLPSGTGIDAAGIVDEVGPGVADISLGESVFGSVR